MIEDKGRFQATHFSDEALPQLFLARRLGQNLRPQNRNSRGTTWNVTPTRRFGPAPTSPDPLRLEFKPTLMTIIHRTMGSKIAHLSKYKGEGGNSSNIDCDDI